MVKIILLTMAFVSLSLNAQASVTVDVDGETYFCSKNGRDSGGEHRCVPNCRSRDGNGDCFAYKKDFCGIDATCSPNCKSRDGNGDCFSYSSDICRAN